MKFSSREDIEAPVSDVFDMLSEFESFERSAIRRGVEVERLSDATTPQCGMKWRAQFDLRGKRRDLSVELVEFDRPNAMKFQADSQGLDGAMTLELLALSPRRTRLSVDLDLTPKTLSARLLVQSLKLAKSSLTKRFKLRVAGFAKDMEDRHSRLA